MTGSSFLWFIKYFYHKRVILRCDMKNLKMSYISLRILENLSLNCFIFVFSILKTLKYILKNIFNDERYNTIISVKFIYY